MTRYTFPGNEYRPAELDVCGWELEDAEEQNEKFPSTFEIPDLEERTTIQPGGVVKMLFALQGMENGESVIQVERMFVNVLAVSEGSSDGDVKYKGALCNEPVTETADDLTVGDTVYFEPRHVAMVQVTKFHPMHPEFTQEVRELVEDARRNEEPFFHGRPWSYLKGVLEGDDVGKMLQVLEFLGSANSETPEVFPVLLKLATERTPSEPPQMEAVRAVASFSLPRFGQAAAEAINDVILNGNVGEDALNLLVHALGDFKIAPLAALPAIRLVKASKMHMLDDRIAATLTRILEVLETHDA